MSSYSYASYESAAVRAARELRAALLDWEGARMDRRDLARGCEREAGRRSGITLRVADTVPIPVEADAAEIARITADLTRETSRLRDELAGQVRASATRAAEEVLAAAAPVTSVPPSSRTTPGRTTPDRTTGTSRPAPAAPAVPVDAKLRERIRDFVERAASAGVDQEITDASAAAAGAAATSALAEFALSTLEATIDRVERERELRAEQAALLARIAAVAALDDDGAGLAAEVDAALARLAEGESLDPTLIDPLAAQADGLEQAAGARLAALDEEVVRRELTARLESEGYVVLDAPQTLVPSGGVLFARPGHADLAVKLDVGRGRAEFRAVRTGGVRDTTAEAAFEKVMCDDLVTVEREAQKKGVRIRLSRYPAVIGPLVGAAASTGTSETSSTSTSAPSKKKGSSAVTRGRST